MFRIPLLAIASCFALQASPVVFSSCTSGNTTVTSTTTGCSLSNPPFNNAVAEVDIVAAQPTPQDINIQVESSAYYNFCPDVCPQPPLSASGRISINDIDYTPGPVRSGFIRISGGFSNENGDSAGWTINDGLHVFPDCGLPGFMGITYGCAGTTPLLPFELGVPFSFNALIANSVSVLPGQRNLGAAGGVILGFTLFEADGTTPVAVLPEPSTYALMFAALGFLPIVLLTRRRGL